MGSESEGRGGGSFMGKKGRGLELFLAMLKMEGVHQMCWGSFNIGA